MEVSEKSEKEAAIFRKQGKLELLNENYFNALLLFNKSLCFAADPKRVSLCYDDRAFVYMRLKLYERCLNNIKLARKDYPKELKKRLDEREENCLKEYLAVLDTETETDPTESFLKLSYPANPKLPFAAECLELKENEKFGRHIITNRNLKVGDIIAITPNIYNVINKSARFHHCSFCLKSNDLDLLPCPNCPEVMYCSRKCMDADSEESHYILCQTKNKCSKAELALRMGYRALLAYGGLTQELIKDLNESKLHSVFDFDFSNCHNPKYCKNMMLAAMGGQKHKNATEADKFSAKEDFFNVLQCFLDLDLPNHLEPHTVINTKVINNEILPSNLCEYTLLRTTIGWSFHPLEHMFNTNCHPNLQVVRFVERGLSVWVVKNPVKAGGQLFKRYRFGESWQETDKSERQLKWKTHGFVCDCEACVNDWKLEDVRNYHGIIKIEIHCDSIKAKKKYKENCKYINKNYKKEYPSAKILAVEKSNEMYLEMISKPNFFSLDGDFRKL